PMAEAVPSKVLVACHLDKPTHVGDIEVLPSEALQQSVGGCGAHADESLKKDKVRASARVCQFRACRHGYMACRWPNFVVLPTRRICPFRFRRCGTMRRATGTPRTNSRSRPAAARATGCTRTCTARRATRATPATGTHAPDAVPP